jgi:DNA-nicking Smr family endonuclease
MGNLFGKKASKQEKHEDKGKAPAKESKPKKAQEHPPASAAASPPPKQEQVIKEKGKQPEDEVLSQDDIRAQELRDKAGKHAKARGDYYEQSQQAFKNGDKAAAKELSEKGKKEQALMEEANQQAADLIFHSKNKNQPPDSIDLHLLLVAEAVERTEKRIKQAQDKKEDHLIVIHGAGHHSKDNKQMIKPAIVKLLNEKGLKFQENTPNIGCVTVQF